MFDNKKIASEWKMDDFVHRCGKPSVNFGVSVCIIFLSFHFFFYFLFFFFFRLISFLLVMWWNSLPFLGGSQQSCDGSVWIQRSISISYRKRNKNEVFEMLISFPSHTFIFVVSVMAFKWSYQTKMKTKKYFSLFFLSFLIENVKIKK